MAPFHPKVFCKWTQTAPSFCVPSEGKLPIICSYYFFLLVLHCWNFFSSDLQTQASYCSWLLTVCVHAANGYSLRFHMHFSRNITSSSQQIKGHLKRKTSPSSLENLILWPLLSLRRGSNLASLSVTSQGKVTFKKAHKWCFKGEKLLISEFETLTKEEMVAMSVTFRFLHKDGNLPAFFKPLHADLQTLLVSALLFSPTAHGFIKTPQNVELMCLFWTVPVKV